MENIIDKIDFIRVLRFITDLYEKKVYKQFGEEEHRTCYFCFGNLQKNDSNSLIVINFLKIEKFVIEGKVPFHKDCMEYYLFDKINFDRLLNEGTLHEFYTVFMAFQDTKHIHF
jgi:hypothetical protein